MAVVRVIVVGASGNIGTSVVQALSAASEVGVGPVVPERRRSVSGQ
jgi:dihydrodipicolinate reductase